MGDIWKCRFRGWTWTERPEAEPEADPSGNKSGWTERPEAEPEAGAVFGFSCGLPIGY